ncbi:M48 family metallopeptidase [Vibrio sp. 16]|uniref:M48 family metallopeptidase n=1 Tax=Vibrio sp. 16 TaxID=391586 RepID=UPI00018F2767|nr:M48 family metallopeptidase [Vibrio sp. 16]EED26644.1 Zn-dependent protease with chaperone function [Vibrio sp. 16]CAK4069624.1 Beta-barrel assembly-enhancing protease [Vibrio sp. 16]
MRFQGSAFPPNSSVRLAAELDASSSTSLCIVTEEETVYCEVAWVEVSAPVGNLPIRFKFADGWMFVADRTPQINQWLKRNKRSSFVEKMETKRFAWLLSVVCCIGVIVGSYVYLLPWLSEKVAHAVPDPVAVALGDKVLASLDEHWAPSELSTLEQEQIRTRVSHYLSQIEPLPYSVDIVFRSSEMGANAFALPGGKIVVLDQMVKLAANEQQLDSIILHELGHVHHRHMLKRLVHSSILSVGVSLLTGESSGVIDNMAGVGVFFLSNGHSREAEMEADEYAKHNMRVIYGSSEAMAEMFEQFSQQEEFAIPEWLSSHPDFDERIEAARN